MPDPVPIQTSGEIEIVVLGPDGKEDPSFVAAPVDPENPYKVGKGGEVNVVFEVSHDDSVTHRIIDADVRLKSGTAIIDTVGVKVPAEIAEKTKAPVTVVLKLAADAPTGARAKFGIVLYREAI